MLANGTILFSFRHNQIHGLAESNKSYRIRVFQSVDVGASWTERLVY